MKKILVLLCLITFLSGCRGWRTEKAPIHLNPNLDFQASIRAQEQPLEVPENTVPWGDEHSFENAALRAEYIKSDTVYYEGKSKSGAWVSRIPIPVTYALLDRGQERYNIYCSVCHGKDGSGVGSVTERAWIQPAPYWDKRVLQYKDGELFDIITNGIRTMPGYSIQIDEKDRWAIVSYIRALQTSQTASVSDVPAELKSQIQE